MFIFVFDNKTNEREFVLDENQAEFLRKFIDLYWGNFIKWRLKKEGGEVPEKTKEEVTQYILNILRVLGGELRMSLKSSDYHGPDNIAQYIEW